MRVAVVGAGAAGLASARHLSATHTCVVFERTAHVGGTWVYTDATGLDSDGLPVHSSMYKSLRTNLPKEVMGFPDFPFKEQDRSYLHADEVLQYLEAYADAFDVRRLIKFEHLVKSVIPRGDMWEISTLNTKTNETKTENFDAVMVCSGHYWSTRRPNFVGSDKFRGWQIHSHDYRTPDPFKDRRVLIIGAGPSGTDITYDIATVAKQVYFSHHEKTSRATLLPTNAMEKPDVQELSEYTAIFVDGTVAEIDAICYCTGYNYSYPFLTPECGVAVEDNHVKPLYKQVVCAYRPTLCFIGIPFIVCPFPLFDLQVRFFVAILNGTCKIPSTEDMLEDIQREAKQRQVAGMKPHVLGNLQDEYFSEMANLSQTTPLPPVIVKLHRYVSGSHRHSKTFREYRYRIVDEQNFVQI